MKVFGETKGDLLKALWDAHVRPFINEEPTTDIERQTALLKVLRHHKEQAEALMAKADLHGSTVEDRVSLATAVENSRIVLTMLTSTAAGWLIDYEEWSIGCTQEQPSDLDAEMSRQQLRTYLSRETSPYFSEALDPTCVLMPRKLADALIRALEALDHGDSLPLLRPSEEKGDFILVEARGEALMNIYFLIGQGFSVTAARKRVASATGIPENTLRDWQSDVNKDEVFKMLHVDLAIRAGKLKAALDANPNYAKGDGNMIDINEEHFISKRLERPLKVFGDWYRATYSKRHWGDKTAE